MLQIDFLNMDLEAMITSAWASGFPQFMVEVCKNLEFEELLKTRLVSVTFYNFLMDKNQRSIWIQASNKVFSTFLKDAFIEEKFPVVNYSFSKDMNIFEQEWIEVFEKVQETATVPEIIKFCHLLRETENPGKFCESSKNTDPLSMLCEMSNIFKEQDAAWQDTWQDGHLFKQIRQLLVTAKMLFYYGLYYCHCDSDQEICDGNCRRP